MSRTRTTTLILAFAAVLGLAACQTTSQGTGAPGAASGASPTASAPLNKDWGSCAHRNCGRDR